MSSINATVVRAVQYGSKLTQRGSVKRDRRPRLVLCAILACAALVYFWRLGVVTNNGFYTVAVRSMAQSWKAFFYGSFNPGNSITIDKIPGYLWPQALSARIFGFHAWAVTLPEVIEALVSVIVIHRMVRRWAGEVAGLFAAAFLVLTPALIGAARLNNEEAAYVMCLVLAASATQRAVSNGRLRTLVAAGVWVGLAFQCKMVEAWAVLPALAVAYLLAAPPNFVRRLVHLAIAGLTTLAVSVAWIVCVALVPAGDRPYIDGTTNNNPFSMVFGYNALTRFSFLGINASSVGSVGAMGHGGGGGGGAGTHAGSGTAGAANTGAAAFRGGGGGGNTHSTLLSMFERDVASQVGWFYALALVSIVAVLWLRRREPRTDPLRAGFLMWSIWLVIFGLAYSTGTIHTYYVVTLGPALAAVCGAGVVELWRAYRAGGRSAWFLPVAVALTDLWAIYIVDGYSTYRGWLIPVLAVLGVVALAALVAALLRPNLGRRTLLLGIVAGVLAAAVAPGAWASTVITASGSQGGNMMGNVGPSTGGGFKGFGGFGAFAGTARAGTAQSRAARAGGSAGFKRHVGGGGTAASGASGASGAPGTSKASGAAAGFGGMFIAAGANSLTAQQKDLLDYAQAHDDGAEFVLTVTSWSVASPYILSTGADVLPMGGFTGQAGFPSLPLFQQYVKQGQVRFVLLPAQVTGATGAAGAGGFAGFAGMFGGGARSGTALAAVETWVRADCATVPATSYGGTAPSSTTTPASGVSTTAFTANTSTNTLYDCTRS
jgi:4-amino-4-deoxy-L-arabinose transferase-like glycosyltransferase